MEKANSKCQNGQNGEPSDDYDDDLSDVQQRELDKIVQKMVRCRDRILELETMEVDFDDEVRSSFLELSRCKDKLIKLYYQGCEIKGYTRDAGRPLLMEKRLEITGDPRFDEIINISINSDGFNIPTYHDILDCIQFCNQEDELGMSKSVEASLGEYKVIYDFIKDPNPFCC